MNRITIIGMNHKTAPVEIRERMAFPENAIGRALMDLAALPDVSECVILSTCNRVELCVRTEKGREETGLVRRFFSSFHGIPLEKILPHLYIFHGEEAARHLFQVSGSLDSMILGEPQILGQVKEAYLRAVEHKTVGSALNKLFTKAFFVAKRIRTETRVANSAVSVSYAAVELAKKILGSLRDKTVMLIGAGDMGKLAARSLLSAGVSRLFVTNRTFERAKRLASDFGGTPFRFEELRAHLEYADTVLSSTGSPGFILSRSDIAEVIRRRKNRPMFFIDVAVPRDIDPDANQVENVYVYDIDDLNNVIETNIEEREKEREKAEEIVGAEVALFSRWMDSRKVIPTIISLRRKFDDIREAEIRKTLSSLGPVDVRTRKAMESLALAIINKALHSPISTLKRDEGGRGQAERIAAARELFELSDVEEMTEEAFGDREKVKESGR
ncbi:MAG: glutamyl-tRNA reductase [Syntrophorhabdaceae bacterium]|nr:glutamyl-tRNA reductase [Syntrophorhabdaceae bacterium]